MSQDNPYASSDFDENISRESANEHEPARRMLRLAAAIADGLVLMAIIIPIGIMMGYFARNMAAAQGGPPVSVGEQLLMGLFGHGAWLLVNGYLLAKRGQSVGKFAAGIKIVDNDTNQLVPFGKLYAMRYMIIAIVTLIVQSIVPILGSLVGLVNVLPIFGSERRCVHDYLANTKVVVKNQTKSLTS